MTLDELISALEKVEDQDRVLPIGFAFPHSYRGYYDELAFEPAFDVSVASMLTAARAAVGSTYHGWKGGAYTMHGSTPVWLSEEGTASEEAIGPTLLRLLLAQRSEPTG